MRPGCSRDDEAARTGAVIIREDGSVPGSTPAIARLVDARIAHRVHRIAPGPSAPAYGQAAADGLAVDPARVFKTLVCTVRGQGVVAVVPVTGELDLKALAGALGAKGAELADRALAQRFTGYVIGGISPIGQKRELLTVIDASALKWDTIFVSGGRRGLELELAPIDLVNITSGQVALIARSN
jgi:Cys-tRNA(Pro)/Cys-tRNA(Cys) deacylase